MGQAGSPSQLTASRVPDLAWRPVSGSDFPGTSRPAKAAVLSVSARLLSLSLPLLLLPLRLFS